MKGKWKTRKRGSSRQRGKPFFVSDQSLRAKKLRLPKIQGAVTPYPTGKVVNYTIENMPIEELSTRNTIIQDPNPKNFEARVNHFITLYKNGETIPPILFHRLKDGRIQILDGRARMEAFRRMKVSKIPAVENGMLDTFKSGVKRSAGILRKGASKTIAVTKKGVVTGKKVVGKSESGILQTARRLGQVKGFPSALKEAYISGQAETVGKGIRIAGHEGGGDIIIPRKRSRARVTKDKPLVHRPCVIERKVKGKTLRTYGTLLDPRTNPRYMQKYGYTNIE